MKTKNIGLQVEKAPSKECKDKLCPFHGNIKLRGKDEMIRLFSVTKQNHTLVC